ncbi:trypsin inhibitor B-like [Prosopis cineraria]|uniref:trypsin inhibitor B-like n=1 Tax=Prosopis cineraria TaxID=364024 RepID=UPI002410AE3C|nr:trypsin inhibitor B-like [Prosopis cineraria]
MKPTAFLSFVFFLLFAFTATTISADMVFDSDGEVMINGGKYYLSPSTSIGGGAIVSAAIRNGDSHSCSLAVVSAPYAKGWAVTISSPHLTTFISTALPLYISFAYLPPNVCTDSPNWVVIKSLPVGEPVMLGSAEEFGSAYVSGWFFIKTHDSEKHYYKLVFCEHGNDHCGDIGVKVDGEERRRLVVTDKDPLVFKFDKVNETYASDLSMVV